MLQVQLEVGPDPAEVGRARRWARSRLVGSGIRDDEPLAETLILLISELVTNAVVHTGCPAVLHMLFGSTGTAGTAGTVRVEVADASCRPPQQRHAEGEDTGGRGWSSSTASPTAGAGSRRARASASGARSTGTPR